MIGWRLAPVLGVFVLPLLAQDTNPAVARLHGHVVDETNAPLSGAEVTLGEIILDVEGRERRVFADPTGAFTLEVPKPGEYSLRVALPGYFDLRGRKVQINSGSNEISLILNRVRDRLESLDVSGTSSVIEMDRTAPEERLTSAELLDVPYKTNNDLRNSMRVLPGVIQD
ncbi:MAG: carboxypeptidase-like regulatory domain-containing protein, partial [Acidobacteriota bacterium]|nr:carboxypeptidase-like regulatory domain-containing protein [Acidobacteriota bacterium]